MKNKEKLRPFDEPLFCAIGKHRLEIMEDFMRVLLNDDSIEFKDSAVNIIPASITPDNKQTAEFIAYTKNDTVICFITDSQNEEEMSRNEKELQGVTLLGNQGTKYQFDYRPDVLETFVNKHPGNEYLVTFDCPEFTSLCPKTGQPDFGRIVINYIPRERMVESKSLKLYLFSFRNHGDFHDDCVNIIMIDLIKLMDPK